MAMETERKRVFMENKLNFIKGQSSKVKHFAEKSLASLGSSEVSVKGRNDVVEQSKILCEDYIYNRLAIMLHLQQERHLKQSVGKQLVEQQQQQQLVEQQQESPTTSDNSSDSSIDRINTNENAFFLRSISRLFSQSDQDVFIQSSPDKVGLIRFEKWRNRLPEVLAEILDLGQKLENAYPFLYDNLSSQLKMPLRSEAALTRAMTCIGDCMFENGFVTWYRIVAMFAVAGAVALEVVDNRKGNLISPVVQVFSQIIDRHVAHWVCKQGGWVAIVPDYQPINKTYQQAMKLFGFVIGFWVAILIPIRFFNTS